MSVEFETILELLGLFASPDQLNNCKELLVSLVFFLKLHIIRLDKIAYYKIRNLAFKNLAILYEQILSVQTNQDSIFFQINFS